MRQIRATNRLYRLEIWIWNNISEGYEIISEDYENISEGYENISEDYEIISEGYANISEGYANISEGFYSAARPERAEAPSPGRALKKSPFLRTKTEKGYDL